MIYTGYIECKKYWGIKYYLSDLSFGFSNAKALHSTMGQLDRVCQYLHNIKIPSEMFDQLCLKVATPSSALFVTSFCLEDLRVRSGGQ